MRWAQKNPLYSNQRIIKCQLVFILQIDCIQKDCNLCVNAKTLNYYANFVAKNMFSMCQDRIVPKVFFCV